MSFDFDKEDEAETVSHWWKGRRGAKWMLLLVLGMGFFPLFFRSRFVDLIMAVIGVLIFIGLAGAYVHEFRFRGEQMNARLAAIQNTLQAMLKSLDPESDD